MAEPPGGHGGRGNQILRPGARAILLDARDRLLLFRTRVPGGAVEAWITPGGGLEPGESHEAAARRELWEETGLRDAALGPWVWSRRQSWRWGETWYDSPERFFLVRVGRLDVRPQQLGGDGARIAARAPLVERGGDRRVERRLYPARPRAAAVAAGRRRAAGRAADRGRVGR
ncbi:MAG: NUDIX domain-containing protein [Dehalococcoidia bacterium]|nr:NUDIX domain-containing protein [Dehalococcoidia bacterium]